MGCDIHFYVERLQGDKYVSVDEWVEKDGYIHVPWDKSYYSGRNYDLFAILANVRNGYGFAGVDTGEGFVPIAKPRGLPDDLSPEVQRVSDAWDIDGHSHTWFDFIEILSYDWTQTTTKRGMVNMPNFAAWDNEYVRGRQEMPKEYCSSVSGGLIEHVSEKEMRRRIDDINENTNNTREVLKELEKCYNVYCVFEQEMPYHKCCEHFWYDTIPRLTALGHSKDTRIVFWFDN